MLRSRHFFSTPALFFLLISALAAPVALCDSFPFDVSQTITAQEDTPVEYPMIEVPDVVGMDLAQARLDSHH
jgi:hypothetical protein